MSWARRVWILAALVLLSSCAPSTNEQAGAPAPTPPPPAVPADAPSPFHVEALERLRDGKMEDARLALENALLVDPRDSYSHMLLGAIFLLQEKPGNAVRHYVDALYTDSQDCMMALGLATARRRVDVNAGSEPVLKDILSYANCPADAYRVAAYRLARMADDGVATGRLPSVEPDLGTSRTLRLVELTSGGPSVPDLAKTVHEIHGGQLTALGDRYSDRSETSRIDVHWIADRFVLLDARTAPEQLPRLSAAVDTVLAAWAEGDSPAKRHPAWIVSEWQAYRDSEIEFSAEIPAGWDAHVVSDEGVRHLSFSAAGLDEEGQASVRSGKSPAFDLVARVLKDDDPPPWNDEYVFNLVNEVSRYFAGADHATEPRAEIVGDEPGQLPGVFLKRTFVVGNEVYRLAAAELNDGTHLYRIAVAGPAVQFDLIEEDFWRFAGSLRKNK